MNTNFSTYLINIKNRVYYYFSYPARRTNIFKSYFQVLESSNMPARMLKISYKLVNTETKLLHRLLQAHGLIESMPESKDFNLLWSGLHPKPDVLRSMAPYQRVNHFPRYFFQFLREFIWNKI